MHHQYAMVSSLDVLLERSREEQLHKQIGFNYQRERYSSAKIFLWAPTWIFFYKIIICILNLGFVIQLNIWQSPCCLHVFSLGKSYIYFFLHLFLNLLFSLGIFLLLPNKSNLISVHPWKPALQKPEPPFVLQCRSVKCSKGKSFSLALLIKY